MLGAVTGAQGKRRRGARVPEDSMRASGEAMGSCPHSAPPVAFGAPCLGKSFHWLKTPFTQQQNGVENGRLAEVWRGGRAGACVHLAVPCPGYTVAIGVGWLSTEAA